MLTYALVCVRIPLTYAHVCSRMRAYTRLLRIPQQDASSMLPYCSGILLVSVLTYALTYAVVYVRMPYWSSILGVCVRG
jgi:hypothetical protein